MARSRPRETADPVPGPGQLLLKVLSGAICASDVHFMDHPEAWEFLDNAYVFECLQPDEH